MAAPQEALTDKIASPFAKFSILVFDGITSSLPAAPSETMSPGNRVIVQLIIASISEKPKR